MTWSNAATELRTLLSDGPTDKLSWRKRCLGLVNGSSTSFKTFEGRRVTDLSTATGNFGVFVNGSAVSVSSDNKEVGQFTLASAPADGTYVEATYYLQWFTDDEIVTFLGNAMQWLGLGSDYTTLVDGLQPAALKYAASEAYQKMSIRWALELSDIYKMQDQISPEVKTLQDPYKDLTKEFKKQATEARDEYYKRQGQSLAPLYGTVAGRVKRVVPNR